MVARDNWILKMVNMSCCCFEKFALCAICLANLLLDAAECYDYSNENDVKNFCPAFQVLSLEHVF